MSSNLGAGKALELLDGLKSSVRDLTDRADGLDDGLRAATARERLHRDNALAEQDRRADASLTEEDSTFEAAKAATESKFQKRKSRLTKAGSATKVHCLEEIERKTGDRKYALQKRMLQAERGRETSPAEALVASTQFKNALAAEQEILAGLEKVARGLFRGCGTFARLLLAAAEPGETAPSGGENQMLADFRTLLGKVSGEVDQFRKFRLFRACKHLTVWSIIIFLALLLALLLRHGGIISVSYAAAAGVAVAAFAIIFALRFIATRKATSLAVSIADTLAKSRQLHNAALRASEADYQQDVQRTKDELNSTTLEVDQQLKQILAEAAQMRVTCRLEIDQRTVRASANNDRLYHATLNALGLRHTKNLELLKQAAETRRQSVIRACEEQERKLTADYQAQWQALEAEWKNTIQPLYDTIYSANATVEKLFPHWDVAMLKSWASPAKFVDAAKFAQLEVDLEQLANGLPKDKRLSLPGSSKFSLPLCLGFPDEGSLLFETASTGHDAAVASLNNTILRLLSVSPPGKLNFTIIDPIGLGQNFAGVMHLADYEEQIINSRIWTQTPQIEQRLADLNEHMEKVIQMYLRNEYQTIAEYNEQAGVIAEKYHFLVVADFPSNFSELAAKRLLSIAASGARCGVYTLIHWDLRQPLPQDFIPDELRKSSICLTAKGQDFIITGYPAAGVKLLLDAPPDPELATGFVQKVGRSSHDSSRVEVPFTQVAPAEAEIWTEDATGELRVPIGRTGATKLQYLAIGKGTRQHGLIAGKTGSGKSTLFHVIITNLSLWCNPEQVEFYLVDFKKGVEFKCYAVHSLPHARVVAIESDREFGLSVLQRVDDELKRRGDLFRKLGVQDLTGYKRAGGTEPVPRSLLLIDEFQEFFVEDDTISQTASMLLDRIVRQGRAFGIHVLLGSQTLGGAYTVARTTLGQMVIRIALQCNEADAYLIMDDTNPAPRLLSRPGEGIYNDMAGAIEGNSPFQTVWLPDQVREGYLQKIRAQADRNRGTYPGPIIFEGNAPADVRDNPLLRSLLEARSITRPSAARIWLGAPNSIKGPTEAVFSRQSGNNLLLVGQRDEATLAILSLAFISLAAQYPIGAARFILCDVTPSGSPQRQYLDRIIHAIPHSIAVARANDLEKVMKDLGDEMKKRSDDADAATTPPTFLLIHGLQQFNKLRYEEDFGFSTPDAEAPPNPAILLNDLICEGTRLGFHVIATCDTYNNANRFLSRKAFSEFEMRVLFQMSANDSANLIDNPKASLLGLHRALYYNAQQGYLETFRPYALPPAEWVDDACRNLARLLGPKS